MIQIGNTVRDVVTGFTGIATARVEYLNGCVQFCVTPKVIDGKFPDGTYLDHQRLELIDEGVQRISRDTGGVMSDAPSSSYRG